MQPSRSIQDSDARAATGAPAAALAIEVAARHAANRGVEVRIVLQRAPGVVAAVRDAAAAAGVVVSTTITANTVSARFGARNSGAGVRAAELSIQ